MAIASFSEIRAAGLKISQRNSEHANLFCILERIGCGDPHQLFTFFLVLLQSLLPFRLCRIPLLQENLCCARLTVSELRNVCVCERRRQRRQTRPASMTRVEICSLVGEGGKPCRADVDSRTSSGLLAISVGERSNAASLAGHPRDLSSVIFCFLNAFLRFFRVRTKVMALCG